MLPVLVSIPHGGDRTPIEIQHMMGISDRDIFYDSDAHTLAIYDATSEASCVVSTQIARCFVDVNRPLYNGSIVRPDGLLKSHTCHNVQVYKPDMPLDYTLRNTLIRQYYMPYHRRIQRLLHSKELQLCLDCHSMAENPPTISPDHNNNTRPLFCLSNYNGQSSSNESLSLLADCISKSFDVDRTMIWTNTPFQGGHITRTYGMNPHPWIQIEINRSMYLSEEWFNDGTLQCSESRIRTLNQMFISAIRMYFGH